MPGSGGPCLDAGSEQTKLSKHTSGMNLPKDSLAFITSIGRFNITRTRKTEHIMRKITWIPMTALLGLISMAQATSAATQPALTKYDALITFGDSYCDVGNLFVATGGAEPAAPYYNGRFSNGPIWLDHVAGFLGVPFKASLLGGTDYAFGGAWVTEPESVTDLAPAKRIP
jgi:hypothetical protein